MKIPARTLLDWPAGAMAKDCACRREGGALERSLRTVVQALTLVCEERQRLVAHAIRDEKWRLAGPRARPKKNDVTKQLAWCTKISAHRAQPLSPRPKA